MWRCEIVEARAGMEGEEGEEENEEMRIVMCSVAAGTTTKEL